MNGGTWEEEFELVIFDNHEGRDTRRKFRGGRGNEANTWNDTWLVEEIIV